ncbi:TraR/DksA family transcriptional regulator [Pelovirga terrestris]|uniref:TraR/DksA C4-type zinc finger protein n=1 Tax=Pelovirga terrestris TaxID=2771352 RepID=A0A8J6QLU1_9BACT|nr:TraR/DksA C4-type zinc finger protein [Pelovirga terrestris]MBD1400834.1 TraR/DksA C4-type zinc finger protein [Pelovirga terrestris]
MSMQQNIALPLRNQDHYLDDDQLDYFLRILTEWRERLQIEYSESRRRIRLQDERVGDIVDQSIKESGTAMEMINYRRKRSLLVQVEAALQRISAGTYGYCLMTEEEIGVERLRSYPIATLSVEAQELVERRRHWNL